MRISLLVAFQSLLDFSILLEVLRMQVMSIPQVNAIIRFCCFDSFVPVTGGLIKFVQQIVTFAALQKLFRLVLQGKNY